MRLVRCALAIGLIAGVLGSLAAANAASPNTLGKTTVQQRVVPTGSGSFTTLTLGPGEPYVVRQDLVTAGSTRTTQRRSLAYFGQLSDFQLADEESPARVEFLDPPNGNQFPFSAAWRPWEANAVAVSAASKAKAPPSAASLLPVRDLSLPIPPRGVPHAARRA